jgi:hypothetical protein
MVVILTIIQFPIISITTKILTAYYRHTLYNIRKKVTTYVYHFNYCPLFVKCQLLSFFVQKSQPINTLKFTGQLYYQVLIEFGHTR